MAKPTVKALKQMVAELLQLKPSADRYDQLKKEIKAGLVALV